MDLYPVPTDKLSFELEEGEAIAWQGSADLMGLRAASRGGDKVAWSLSSPADLFITNRRLVYLCRKFEKGKQHLFSGGVGSAMMVGSTVKAAIHRHGRVAAGHVQNGSSIRLRLRVRRHDNAQFAEDLVRRITEFRLSFGYQPPLSDDVTTALKMQSAEAAVRDLSETDKSTRLCYDLAGAPSGAISRKLM
jgi:hypothetical protein